MPRARIRWFGVFVGVVACSGNKPPPSIGLDAATDIVAPADRPTSDIVPVDPCGPAACGPVELCGPSPGSGNGFDDNCDGRVDEGCPCTPGEMRACFPGAPDRRGVGACADGEMRCTELAAWVGNECRGATVPRAEVCNRQDDDCNGSVDESDAGCAGALLCPSSLGAAPLQDVTVDGRAIDPSAQGFRWSVTCPTGMSPCPSPEGATDATLRLRPVQAGIYRVRLDVTRGDGSAGRCEFPLYVQGRGLRVELDWDRKGGVGAPGADMDLHVGLIDRRRNSSGGWFTNADCYFYTCKAPGAVVQWALDPSDTRFAPSMGSSACENAPPPWGDAWRASGRCWNPRLDTDTITCDPSVTDTRDPAYCFSENFALDVPPEDATFRLMVNFYRDHGVCSDDDPRNDVVHPVLAVHCGGITRAAVGSVEDGIVSMRCGDNPMIGSANWSWLAADVRFVTNACGLSDCRVTPLRGRPREFTPCEGVPDAVDVCQDAVGHVFVRRSGSLAADTIFAESP